MLAATIDVQESALRIVSCSVKPLTGSARMTKQFAINRPARISLGVVCGGLAAVRAGLVATALHAGDESPLLAYPMTVILPAVLVAILLAMAPTETREGALMRLGTVLQLLLIIALPGFALHLALGMPVVFLAVEFVETRVAPRVRDRLTSVWLS